jgi:soluble lytic murein transglycosylase-like protein
MPKNIPVLMVVLATAVAMPSARADIYAYRDENGVLNYTNIRPNDARYQVRVAYKDKRAPAATVHFDQDDNSAPVSLPPRLSAIVDEAADYYAVDKALVQAVIHAESDFNTHAVSVKGARGLMQLMPETAERYGVHDLFDPKQNIMGGVRYLRDLLDDFGNNLRLALAAYNAGESSVLRYGGVPPFPETINYVERVLRLQSAYRDRI